MSLKNILLSFSVKEILAILKKLGDTDYRKSWSKERLVKEILLYSAEDVLNRFTSAQLKAGIVFFGAGKIEKLKQARFEQLYTLVTGMEQLAAQPKGPAAPERSTLKEILGNISDSEYKKTWNRCSLIEEISKFNITEMMEISGKKELIRLGELFGLELKSSLSKSDIKNKLLEQKSIYDANESQQLSAVFYHSNNFLTGAIPFFEDNLTEWVFKTQQGFYWLLDKLSLPTWKEAYDHKLADYPEQREWLKTIREKIEVDTWDDLLAAFELGGINWPLETKIEQLIGSKEPEEVRQGLEQLKKESKTPQDLLIRLGLTENQPLSKLENINKTRWKYRNYIFYQVLIMLAELGMEKISKNAPFSQIDVSYFGIKEFPESIGRLTGLQNLRCQQSSLKTLPETMKNLSSLKLLEIQDNELETLPWVITEMKNLETLDLSGNPLKELPPEIENLTKLKFLNLDYCNTSKSRGIEVFPEYLPASLEELHFHLTSFTHIPESLGKLTKLKSLSIGDSRINSFPESFGNLRNLEMLRFQSSVIGPFPESVHQLEKLTLLEVGGIIENNELEFFDRISSIPNIEELDVRGGIIEFFPPSLIQNMSLKRLTLRSGHIKYIPEEIGNLKNLEYLNLDFNKISSLPPSISKLTRVTLVELAFNELSKLPEEKLIAMLQVIATIPNLEYLNLSYNDFTTLSDSLVKVLIDLDIPDVDLKGNEFSTEEQARLQKLLGEKVSL